MRDVDRIGRSATSGKINERLKIELEEQAEMGTVAYRMDAMQRAKQLIGAIVISKNKPPSQPVGDREFFRMHENRGF